MLRSLKKWFEKTKADFQFGPVAAFFSFWQGRSTFFACLFTAVGIWGFIHHYDLTSFALFATAIQGLIVCHSIKEDYTNIKQQQMQQQNVTVNVDPNTPQST